MAGGSLILLQDHTASNSNKSFTVPAGYVYEVQWANVVYTSNATAGNRQLVMQCTDGVNVILVVRAGIVQAASLTVNYTLGQSAPEETTKIAGTLSVDIPEDLLLLPGSVIQMYDSAAIAAAGDNMLVDIMVKKVRLDSVIENT